MRNTKISRQWIALALCRGLAFKIYAILPLSTLKTGITYRALKCSLDNCRNTNWEHFQHNSNYYIFKIHEIQTRKPKDYLLALPCHLHPTSIRFPYIEINCFYSSFILERQVRRCQADHTQAFPSH